MGLFDFLFSSGVSNSQKKAHSNASYTIISATSTVSELKMSIGDESIWIKCKKQQKRVSTLRKGARCKSGKTKCARFEKRNVQKSGKTKRSKNFAHTTL